MQFEANRSRNTEAKLLSSRSKMKIVVKRIGNKSPDFQTFNVDKFRASVRPLPAYVHVLLRRKHLRCVDATVAEPVTLTAMVKTLGPAVESRRRAASRWVDKCWLTDFHTQTGSFVLPKSLLRSSLASAIV